MSEDKTKRKAAIEAEPKPTDETFIQVLRELGKPATSREISDALGFANPDYGRAFVRRAMERLAKNGKVLIAEAPEDVRAKRLYSSA